MRGIAKESMRKYSYLLLLFKAMFPQSTERASCLFFNLTIVALE